MENQTVWKSDNQGVKEETFIQTGRRGGDRQPGAERTCDKAVAGEPGWVGVGWQSGQSHICVWINQEERLASETDHGTKGFSVGS